MSINMTRVPLLCGALALAAACGTPGPTAVVITEEGCVTGSRGEFILTSLQPGVPHPGLEHEPASQVPQPTSEAYRLIGGDDQLRDLTGERVTVTGEADPARGVQIRMMSAPTPPRDDAGTPAAGSTDPDAGGAPDVTVDTGTQVRLELHDLDVLTINSSGTPCSTLLVD